jgi:hypothetical protein
MRADIGRRRDRHRFRQRLQRCIRNEFRQPSFENVPAIDVVERSGIADLDQGLQSRRIHFAQNDFAVGEFGDVCDLHSQMPANRLEGSLEGAVRLLGHTLGEGHQIDQTLPALPGHFNAPNCFLRKSSQPTNEAIGNLIKESGSIEGHD